MSESGAANSTPCPEAILVLVERFGQHPDSYKRTTYNDTQVRRQLIDPFFTALGWDVVDRAVAPGKE
jgi:predicted type IV restriction endonuclease